MGSKSQTQKRHSPGSASRLGILAAVIIVAAAAAAGFWQASQNRFGGSTDSLLSDFSKVWTWGNAEFAGGADQGGWSFRWDGEADTESVRRLAERFDIKLIPVKTPLGEAYQGYAQGGLSLWYKQVTPARDGDPPSEAGKQGGDGLPVELIILLSPDKGSKLEIIKTAAAGIEKAAQEQRLSLEGSFTVRAYPADDASAQTIAKLAAARQVEEYEDANTQSLTYSSPELHARIMSGSQSVNLQIVHVLSGPAEKAQLVIGVPLITGDYASGN